MSKQNKSTSVWVRKHVPETIKVSFIVNKETDPQIHNFLAGLGFRKTSEEVRRLLLVALHHEESNLTRSQAELSGAGVSELLSDTAPKFNKQQSGSIDKSKDAQSGLMEKTITNHKQATVNNTKSTALSPEELEKIRMLQELSL